MAKLTEEERNKLPDSDFALPGRKYPIHNLDHARDALSEVAKSGTPEEQATVRAEVKKRYPQIDVQDDKKNLSMIRALSAPHGAGHEFSVAADPSLPKERSGLPCFYYWKDALRPGKYVKPASENDPGFELDVSPQDIDSLLTTFSRMRANGVEVPIVKDHRDPRIKDGRIDPKIPIELSDNTLGYIVAMKRDPNSTLFELHQFLGPQARDVGLKNLVSVGIDENFVDGENRYYGRAIAHSASTPIPVMPGQGEFLKAASRLPAAGDVPTVAAGDLSQRSKQMSCQLTEGQVGSLREEPFMSMSGVPDEKIGEHLVSKVKKTGENLRQLCMAMPGGGDCPPEEAMSRAVQHVKTMHHIASRIMPKNLSLSTMKPEEIQAALDARIDALAKVAEQKDAMDATIASQQTKITELSRQIPANPYNTEDSEASAIENMNMAFDQLMDGKNPFPAVAVSEAKRLFVSPDGKKVNVLTMSRAANQSGSQSIAVGALKLFRSLAEVGFSPKSGQKSGLQSLSRLEPGAEDPDREKDDKAALEFMAKA